MRLLSTRLGIIGALQAEEFRRDVCVGVEEVPEDGPAAIEPASAEEAARRAGVRGPGVRRPPWWVGVGGLVARPERGEVCTDRLSGPESLGPRGAVSAESRVAIAVTPDASPCRR